MDWGMGAVWLICGVATAGVIARPFRWPEAIWAAGGALLLVLLGLMPVGAALGAVGKGLDVYLFLIGMMLLSETAREHGLFDWVAATAAIHAGAARRACSCWSISPGSSSPPSCRMTPPPWC